MVARSQSLCDVNGYCSGFMKYLIEREGAEKTKKIFFFASALLNSSNASQKKKKKEV